MILLPENALINIVRIDTLDGGKVSPQAVNLEAWSGNAGVLRKLEGMLNDNDKCFFPGTLIEEHDGFYTPSMPVIIHGALAGIRRKLSYPPIIEDFKAAAKVYAPELEHQVKNNDGPYFNEPWKTIKERVEQAWASKAFEHSFSYEVDGRTILPVICNEFDRLLSAYNGPNIDVVLHGASRFFASDEEAEAFYEERRKKYSVLKNARIELREAPARNCSYRA